LLETAAATGATAGGGAAMGSGTTAVSFKKKKLGHKKKLLNLNLTLFNDSPPADLNLVPKLLGLPMPLQGVSTRQRLGWMQWQS
jgi:hypothetical protein